MRVALGVGVACLVALAAGLLAANAAEMRGVTATEI